MTFLVVVPSSASYVHGAKQARTSPGRDEVLRLRQTQDREHALLDGFSSCSNRP